MNKRQTAHQTPPGNTEKRGYHHGNLRAALVHATRELLAWRGPKGFTLSDAARKAGVSAAAPYRHFADREALLAAVAQEGFQLFGARIAEAVEGECDPQDALISMGRVYLGFAREEPGYYAAMFAFSAGEQVEPNTDHDTAFQVLIGTIASVLSARKMPDEEARHLAFQIWSLSHGVATLDAIGHLDDCGTSAQTLLIDGAMALLAAAGKSSSR